MKAKDTRHYFFIHVMKTGGTTFDSIIARNVAQSDIYVHGNSVPWLIRQRDYVNVHRLLMNVRLAPHRPTFLRGHFPFAATELIPDPGITLTLLRHPVERTISFLRHAQKFHPEHRGLDVEEIYDDEWWYPRFVDNYQCKLFGMTRSEAVASRARPSAEDAAPDPISSRGLYEFLGPHPTELVRADDACLARARSNLDSVDVVGFTDRYLDFLIHLRDAFGWKVDTVRERNQSDNTGNVPPSLRRRVERDQSLDIEFYEYARRTRMKDGAS